jgi:branched-chain amino acid transport system permease protein
MNIINFAHGHVAMAAMFASYALNRYLGLDPYLAALCLFPVFLVVGGLVYRTMIAPAVGASHATQMLVTLGLLIMIENGANLIFGGDLRSVRSTLGDGSVHLGALMLPWSRLITAVGSLLAILGLWAFLKFTRFGTEIRAAANNELGARLVGIPIGRVFIQAFALSTAMAAFAGAMLVPFYLINPFVGYDFMLKAFVISIIGGLGSLPGAVLAGLIIGVVEALGDFYLTASYATALVFGLLILVLLWRPFGLMGSLRS